MCHVRWKTTDNYSFYFRMMLFQHFIAITISNGTTIRILQSCLKRYFTLCFTRNALSAYVYIYVYVYKCMCSLPLQIKLFDRNTT